MNEIFDKWQTQLKKGYLELCVLTLLQSREQAYGLEVVQAFQQAGLELNEGTLYPLLNRMQKNGWLESSWETTTSSGHPRRFYALSEAGKAHLPQMREVCHGYINSLTILEKTS